MAEPSTVSAGALAGDAASSPGLEERLVSAALESGRGKVRLRVRGGCMEPLLRDGDWVEVAPAVDLRAGALVLAPDGAGGLVCHRVLRRVDGRCWLGGDRSMRATPVPAERVLGQVRRVRRGARGMRLERPWPRRLGRLVARLHPEAAGPPGAWLGSAAGALRRRLLPAFGLAWWLRRAGAELH